MAGALPPQNDAHLRMIAAFLRSKTEFIIFSQKLEKSKTSYTDFSLNKNYLLGES